MEPFETFEHAGFTVELHPDWDEPTKPSDWDQAGELVAFDPLWREFRFAERNSTQEEDDALERGGLRLLARYLWMTAGATIVPFTYQDYGSSGAILSATDLDSDRAAGFIVTDAARMERVGATDAEAVLRAELREWSSYVAGEIVGYVVRDGTYPNGDVIDSCWGFYPEHFTGEERARYGRPATDDGLEYVRSEARSAAESERDERARRAREVREGWASARVTA